ncbi:hypothetical protein [Pseudomonas zeae]|uniref:hypothetical protein n=1 Tax=Pseudomonas zeae TaxID=2745510 RepID=UPI003CFEE967
MKERPILFNAPMVRAILADIKKVTRRPVRFQPDVPVTDAVPRRNVPHGPPTIDWYWRPKHGHLNGVPSAGWNFRCPYGQPGDRLWVRETFGSQVRRDAAGGTGRFTVYRASKPDAIDYVGASGKEYPVKWKPSIHMPRHLSRVLLEITNVRVERLQEISGDQAEAEGVDAAMCQEYLDTSPSRFECKEAVIHGFAGLWQSTGGNWDANPWVWVVEFKRVTS